MVVKYNVYIASDPRGPWTKVNTTPLSNVSIGNQYTITGLQNNELYYIMVIAGQIDASDNFVAICGQPISNNPEPGLSVNNPNLVAARPKDI